MSDILSNTQFGIIDVEKVEDDITVDMYRHLPPHVVISISPPLNTSEQDAIIAIGYSPDAIEPHIRIGADDREYSRLRLSGEHADQSMKSAIEITQSLVALRGLQAGRLRIMGEGRGCKPDTNLIILNRGEDHSTISATIDVDDFVADSQDPAWQAGIRAAREHVGMHEPREQNDKASLLESRQREPEVGEAYDAIARVARENPGVRWSSREIREAARYGVNPGALGIALDMLEAEGILVRDGEDGKYSLPVNE